ncbi:Hsp70 family protein [Mesorhizobium sp. CN5-321]|uniref:Hsp70 family protein n=1 Tax=Mesorhizobium hunchu TaxID=3157708 RepID=UPI0032B73FBF
MRTVIGGIDFGTSNSTVGLAQDERAGLVPLEGDETTLPSAIFFSFDGDRARFGREAITNYADGVEGRLMRALKSVLGSSLVNEKTRIQKRSMAFIDIVGLFIAELKRRTEAFAEAPFESAVLGRPVHFVDDDAHADRKAQDELEKAARAQGFTDIAFQYEPIAAALDYEQAVRGEETVLIVDMGGGTSDFSIVRVSPERARAADRKDDILANRGVHIGGTDFDRLVSIAHVMPELGYLTPTKDGKRNLPAGYFIDLATWHRINLLYTPKAMNDLRQIRFEAARPDLVERMITIVDHRLGHALAGTVEQAKIALTDADETVIAMPYDIATPRLTRRDFDQTIAQAVQRVAATVSATIEDAGLSAGDITAVFLTGGSTAIPAARQAILQLVPQARVVDGDRFGSVGMGLALEARRKFG